MAIKRTRADDLFSKCIRERADYRCEKCGKQYAEKERGLHCSHNYSRRHRTIRWCKENALALCYACHQWYEGNPPESGRWLVEKIGEGANELLLEKMRSNLKVTKQDENKIADHYQEQLDNMKAARRAGKVGYLDFMSAQ